jgi:tetratricopeptide (TPR) repeat protein
MRCFVSKIVASCFISVSVFIVLPQNSLSITEGSEWWQTLYEQGVQHLHQKDYEGARQKFKEIIDKDSKIAQGHYGLGLVLAGMEPGSDKAIDAFEKATKIKSDYAAAYYQIALVYEQRGKGDKVIEYLRKATERDSAFTPGWNKLAKIILNIELPLESISALSKEIERNPTFVEPCTKYVLDSLAYRFPDASDVALRLYRARVLFALNKAEAGLTEYWSAVNAIQNSSDATLFSADLCYLMVNDEYKKLLQTPIDSLSLFYKVFWQKRDPDLSTEANERISEHYQRLTYVYDKYRRDPEAARSIARMHRHRHPFRRFLALQDDMMGDDLLADVGFTEAIPADRTLDDAALIYIRHGQPDAFATGIAPAIDPDDLPISLSNFLREHFENNLINYDQLREQYLGMDLQPQNLSWRYRANASRPELIFHFFKYGESGWVIEAVPSSLHGRETWGPQYDRLKKALLAAEIAVVARKIVEEQYQGTDVQIVDFESVYADNTLKLPQLALAVEEESIDFLETGLTTESSDLIYDDEPFDFRYQLVSFKGEDGNNWVEIYYAIQGDKTTLSDSGADSELLLSQSFVFSGQEDGEVVRVRKENEIKVGLTQEEWNAKGLLGVEPVSLKPGTFDYEVQFKDKAARRLGVYKHAYENRDYERSGLTMSDVLLVGDIRPVKGGEQFYKADIAYTPKMFSNYRRGEEIGLYFEIYNLTYDESHKTDYRIEYKLQTRRGRSVLKKVFSIFGGKSESVSSDYRYSGTKRDEKMNFTIDLSNRPADNYDIVIEVQDLNSGETFERTVTVKVI